MTTIINTINNTDLANTKRFAGQHAQKAIYTPESHWLVYDGKRWKYDQGNVMVMAMAKKTAASIYGEIAHAIDKDEMSKWARQSQNLSRIKAMVELAESEPAIKSSMAEFDNDKTRMRLNCQNGTLDLVTGELASHEPLDKITRIVKAEYIPDAECPTWLRFMNDIMDGDGAMVSYLQRAIGYSLTGSTEEQVLFFMHGSGSNGKTVFIETLQTLLGDYSMTSRTEVVMARHRSGNSNELARLHGQRFVTMNETREGEKLDEPTVKDMTGGDTISARFLYREAFDFEPAFKLWMRGNHKPTISGMDDGIWRRIHLIPFLRQFKGEEKDKRIGRKLVKELDGILAWVVQGCMEWQRHGLQPPEAVTEAVKEYRADSDLLAQFIEEKYQVGTGLKTKCKPMFDNFKKWSDGGTELNNRTFAPAMALKGFQKSPRTGDGYFYLGIAPKPEPHHSDYYND